MTRQISSASVPGRNNPCVLEHQDNGALRCSRSVKYAFWYNESLTWRELHDALFQIDKQLAFDDLTTTSAVPEPPGWYLLAIGGVLCSLVRHLRHAHDDGAGREAA